MKYFFVNLYTPSKSSGNAKLTPSKQVGFRLFPYLGAWFGVSGKRLVQRVGFQLDMSPKRSCIIYICSVCVPVHWSLWVGDWFLLWMFPVPLTGIKLPGSKSCVLVGSDLRCPGLPWCSAPLGQLLGHMLPFRIKSTTHSSILHGN